MFGLFTKRHNRINTKGDSIFIDNQKENIGKAVELEAIFKLTVPTPEIKVFENQNLVHTFRIDTLQTNKDLTGQFLHSSIRVLSNSAVMIDGIISQSDTSFSKWTDDDYEAIRFQPFYLSDKSDNNIQLKGKGLFERGLHFSGTVTPTGVRNICICDSCKHSFTIQHFHSGFSELQYFYSTDCKETLIVPYGSIENLPSQLQETVDKSILKSIESKLPRPSNNEGTFNYYNSFKCPYCLTPYIDFQKYNDIRQTEYYGNTFINQIVKRWTD
jgi:hypothetical protein